MNDLLPGQHWYPAHRADARARALYLRHYSAFKRKRGSTSPQFVSPGECMVLLTPEVDALFVWHYARPEMRLDRVDGPVCAIFRNEGPVLSSTLILEAEQLAWARWPGRTLWTYVDPRCVGSGRPGWCFIRARWKRVGESQQGRLLFRKRPKGEGATA
jgi:hypothetical protein